MTTFPKWATEEIVIAPYSEQWPWVANEIISELSQVFGSDALAIEHIGSTSIPELAAKPIIDVMVKMKDFDTIDRSALRLSQSHSSWNLVPAELDERPWRRFMVKVVGDHRFAHLHLVPEGQPRWDEHLKFRETLRADPLLIAQYAALKEKLAEIHQSDREAYTDGKAEFIQSVLRMVN
ncbi:MAG: GrpB family protein [Actinobacteria bacterium]|nr:GrpB family protein [Actinomycetota bacterium]